MQVEEHDPFPVVDPNSHRSQRRLGKGQGSPGSHGVRARSQRKDLVKIYAGEVCPSLVRFQPRAGRGVCDGHPRKGRGKFVARDGGRNVTLCFSTQVGKDSGEPLGQECLAYPRRAHHGEVVPACCSNLEAVAGKVMATNIGQVRMF
jgi:hypothetical protein